MTARALLSLLLAAGLLVTVPARAADNNMDEAQRRYRHGTELYKEGDFAAALVEFKRAYELVPSFKILYTLGQVSFQQHDYAAALRYYRQYLDAGQGAVAADRRRELAEEMARLEQRVGRLEVGTAEPGVEIFVDDAPVGATPLAAPVTVNEGRRHVEAAGRGGERASRIVEIPGGELVHVAFPRLGPPEAVALAAPAPRPRLASPTMVTSSPATSTSHSAPAARSGGAPWWTWTAAAVLAAGAGATGALAWNGQRDLQHRLDMYPADADAIANDRQRTHTLALTTDGLLIGAALMAGVSVFLSLR